MSLLQLPDELLCIIGGYLSCYRDVRALILSNRRLNGIFTPILPTYTVKNCHDSLLCCAAHSADIGLVAEVLDRLAAINDRRRQLAASRNEQQTTSSQEDGSDDEEDGARLGDGRLHPDIEAHPLYAAGYRIRDILAIQRAFLASIPTGSMELVTYFLDHGAVVNCGSPSGDDPLPLTLAVQHGHEEIFDMLNFEHAARACDSKCCPMVEAVELRRFHMIRRLLEVGVCIHWDSALCDALDDREVFDFMVDNGVTVEKYGHIALFSAIMEGKKEWVESLVAKGADPNLSYGHPPVSLIQDRKNYSSIHHAVLHGHLEICKLLIGYGVQPDEDDLLLAREAGYDDIVDILSGFSYTDVPEKEDIFTRWVNTHC